MTDMFNGRLDGNPDNHEAGKHLEYILLDCGLNFLKQQHIDPYVSSANTYKIDAAKGEISLRMAAHGEGSLGYAQKY